MARFALFLIASIVVGPVAAESPMPSNSVRDCSWESIAGKYGISPHLLFAIAKQESGLNPSVISKPNKDGSYDIGLVQINSSWLPKLKRDFGITESMLRTNSCVNLDVGAWVLYENFRRHGNTWRAIGAYNAKSDHKRLNYIKKVYRFVPPEMIAKD